ncbi:MAG: succinyldiaminopimelate transaminase [Nocardioides sp.]
MKVSARLPDFPWDRLTASAATARAHPGGVIDLSIGTPVDPTPNLVQRALADAANAPGYPTTAGRTQTRQAAIDWLARRHGVVGLGLDGILPAVGSKELIANLALHLGMGTDDLIVYPELAYPTYLVGAALCGARAVAADLLTAIETGREPLGAGTPRLVWLNSPANPTGRVWSARDLATIVAWCRERGVIVVSDECYLECAWDVAPVSVLHPDVCAGTHEGIVSVHSLSKRSNLAGYRCGFLAGDPAIVGELLAVRKNLGLMMPSPVQAAMTAALNDDEHVAAQHGVYARRRRQLRDAFEAAGFRIDHSQASLYLWATREEDCWRTVGWLAERGILVAPGAFYGSAGRRHVRIAFTATDDRVSAVSARLG